MGESPSACPASGLSLAPLLRKVVGVALQGSRGRSPFRASAHPPYGGGGRRPPCSRKSALRAGSHIPFTALSGGSRPPRLQRKVAFPGRLCFGRNAPASSYRKASTPIYHYSPINKKDRFLRSLSVIGGGGSRTPVLTAHPSTSTGLDPADESQLESTAGQFFSNPG